MEPLFGRNGWVSDLGTWSGLIRRVNRRIKPWKGVGESRAAQRLPDRIRYTGENAPWMRPHLSKKMVMIFGSGIKQESLKQ